MSHWYKNKNKRQENHKEVHLRLRHLKQGSWLLSYALLPCWKLIDIYHLQYYVAISPQFRVVHLLPTRVSSTQLCWRTEGFQSVLSALGTYLLSVNTVLLSLRTQQPNFFPLLQNYWFCYDVYFYKKENRIMKITTRSDWPLVPPEQGSLRHKSCWADLQFCTQKEHEIKPQNELLR